MTPKEKALTIIIMVPLIIFSGIFGYLHYQEYTEQKKALGFWEHYGYIKANAVEAPVNLTGSGWHFIPLNYVCQKYPLQYEIFYQEHYECHYFLMPWGKVETYWVESGMSADMRWSVE